MKQLVLVVDDEVLFADSLAQRLQLRGFDTLVAYNGESALDLFAELLPPLVVLDLRLPDLDGTDVLARIMEQAPKTRVIIITGHGSEEDKKICMDRGAASFLNKPVRLGTLVEELKEGEPA